MSSTIRLMAAFVRALTGLGAARAGLRELGWFYDAPLPLRGNYKAQDPRRARETPSSKP